MSEKQSTSVMLRNPNYQKRFEEMMGKEKAQKFISSVLQVVNNNKLLTKADPKTVINAAATAAAMDLPINQNLGFAYIVPYKGAAQFQMGYKGFIQLAQRSRQYKTIGALTVYESQFVSWDPFSETLDIDMTKPEEGEIVGFAAHFSLVSGFRKVVYWPIEKIKAHATKFSQSYSRGSGPWKDHFDAMGQKTVIKDMLGKYGPMTMEDPMHMAITADQSVQHDEGDFIYPDNEGETDEEKQLRIQTSSVMSHIDKCETQDDIYMLVNDPHVKALLDADETLAASLKKKEAELEDGSQDQSQKEK